MQVRLANDAIEYLQDFKLNISFLNEMVYASAIVITLAVITHKTNCFKKPKEKLGKQI